MINDKDEYLNDNFRTVRQYPYDIRLTGEEAGRKILFSMINYIGELSTAIFKRDAIDSDLTKHSIIDYDSNEIYCLGDISL